MVSLNQIFDISFYKKLFKSKGGNLKKEAEKPNNWIAFLKGCGVSIIGVLILGTISANFVYFSKLDTSDITGEDDEETMGTYFPIPDNLNYGLFVGRSYDDFGPYIDGTTAVVKPGMISLSKFNIPPTGSKERFLGRFPYTGDIFDDYEDTTGFFEMRKKWYIRSIAATYIFWRAILQNIFKVMSYCSPGFKLILSLLVLAIFIGGPSAVTFLISNTGKPSATGFPGMIIMSLIAISITQIRHAMWWKSGNGVFYGGIGMIINLIFFMFGDLTALFVCGALMSLVVILQFIGTFIPPFGPFLFNFSGMLDAMKVLKQPLGILFGFFCIVFAQLHLNKAVFLGMTIMVMLYILVELNNFRGRMYKLLISKNK
jgi:hypothetical protein